MKRLLLGAAAAVVAVAAVAATALWPRDPFAGVPTMRVEPSRFRQRVTAEGNLKAVESTPLTAPIKSGRPQKIAWMVGDGTRVESGDVVVRFDATDFEKELADGNSDRLVASHRIDRARVERDSKKKNLDRDADLARQELANAKDFQTTDSTIYSRMEIIESEIDTDLAEHRTEHAEGSKEIQDQLSQADMDLLDIEHRKAEIKIEQAEQGLDSLAIAAPHDGIVILDRDWRGNTPKVGETVWPGRELATLPELSEMEAEVFVLEADAGGLSPGQRATVFLEAHPDSSFHATVKSVDPIAQRRIRWVPVQYFRAVLSLEHTDVMLMKPGGRVHAEIIIDNLDGVLAVPRQAVSTVDGEQVVHRRAGRSFEAVKVELGASALGRVVITGELQEGDVIALRNPHVSSSEESEGTGESTSVAMGGGA